MVTPSEVALQVGNHALGPTPSGSLFWVMQTVETLVSVYIKGSNKLGKVRYSFAPFNTHSYSFTLNSFGVS